MTPTYNDSPLGFAVQPNLPLGALADIHHSTSGLVLDPNSFLPAAPSESNGNARTAEVTPLAPHIEPNQTANVLNLPKIETTRVWGVDFAQVDMSQVIDRARQVMASRAPNYFITANLNYLMLTAERTELAQVNREADLIIADGYPIVWRSTFTSKRLPERVAGSDMIVELAKLCAERGYRIYFLGAAPGVAQKAAEKLQAMFPALQIAGYAAPPFRQLTDQEHDQLLETIRIARADLLLVAFGQPKGECWIHEHYQQLGVPLSIQLGASFDFLAGTARRAPRFWQAIGCEWLYRSLCEPKRLAPRYLKNIAFLLKSLLREVRTMGGELS